MGGSRKFICVQLPEKTNREDFSTISEIGKERIRRVIKLMQETENKQLPSGDGYQDRGFKVFKLQDSNFKSWRDYQGENLRQFETLLSAFETPLVEGWNEQDVFTEILLIQGFPLNSKAAPAHDFTANKVMQVESEIVLTVSSSAWNRESRIRLSSVLHYFPNKTFLSVWIAP